MLVDVDSFEELDFSSLMEIYLEGNQENAEYFYGEESPERGLALAIRDAKRYLRDDFFPRPEARYYIWTENGKYISALRLEPHADGLLLEALETRPDRRRMGYGKKLIAAVMAQLPAGTHIYSAVTKRNEPSLAFHNACGFCKYLDHCVESDGTISNDHVTFKVTV